jgi:outer membrane receptor for ferrienterochelin and colicin
MNQFSSGGGTGFSMYNIRVYDKELLAELRYKMFENTNLIGGVNVISRYSTGAPNTYAYAITGGPGSTINLDPSLSYTSRSSNYNIYSAYIQAQQNIDFLKGLIITAGGRMDMGRVYAASNGDVISSYNQFSPRVALVQKITEQLNAKLMFGMALRAPLIKEVGLIEEARANPANAAVLNNIPTSVKAENIKTFEGALTYNNNKISVTTTYFNNRTNDPLGKKSVAGVQGEVTANTNGYTKASGFELETSIAPIKQIRLGANYSYAFAEVFTVQRNAKNTADTTVVSRVANVPTVKINGYLTYSIEAPVKVSATLVGRWIENYRIGGVTTARLAGFKVFDLNLVGAVTENVSLEFQVRNLLDAEVRTPAFHNSGLLNLPFPGRSFLGTIAFKF